MIITSVHNPANEIVSLDGSDTSLRTDAAGNMTRIPNPKAVPGQTVAQNLNLTYDAWNRLIRVSTPDGSEVMSCSYDGLNRRVRKTTASETREYYYNKNWQCLEEYLYGTLQNSYLWGLRYLDDLICFTPDYTIALTDANFNVVAVANQSGLTERYTYTAFGQRTILTPSYAPRSESMYPALTRTFTSQVLDQETGVMLYRNRYYVPTLGRFMTRDIVGYGGIDENLYRYVLNNPFIYLDYNGHFAIFLPVIPILSVALAVVTINILVQTAILLEKHPIHISLPKPRPIYHEPVLQSAQSQSVQESATDSVTDTTTDTVPKCKKRHTCDDVTKRQLDKDVSLACKAKGLIGKSCKSYMTYEELLDNKNKFEDCLKKRKKIIDICYNGITDSGHQIQLDETQNAINNCDKYIKIIQQQQTMLFDPSNH